MTNQPTLDYVSVVDFQSGESHWLCFVCDDKGFVAHEWIELVELGGVPIDSPPKQTKRVTWNELSDEVQIDMSESMKEKLDEEAFASWLRTKES